MARVNNRIVNQVEMLHRRPMFAFGVVALGFLALTCRLLFLQGLHGQEIRAAAIKSRREIQTTKGRRGSILSSDGSNLATSTYQGALGFDATLFANTGAAPAKQALLERELHESVLRVAQILGVSPKAVEEGVNDARARYARLSKLPPQKLKGVNTKSYILKDDLDLETSTAIKSAMNPSKQANKESYARPIVGFGVIDSSFRSYEQEEAGLQMIGYIDKAERPTSSTGLERSYDQQLKQSPGSVTGERDRLGRLIPLTDVEAKTAMNGADVHTTIDLQVQQTAAIQAKLILEKYHPLGVSIIVMEPNSGDIWTMLSYPSISLPALRSSDLEESQVSSLLTERCFSQVYEPGSTMKALTIALALESHAINKDTFFNCSGAYNIGNHPIKDSHHETHGWIGLNEILAKSCNICAAQIGLQMQPGEFTKGIRKLGLLSKPGLGMKFEKGGHLATDYERVKFGRMNESRDNLARIAFGQSITTTPLNMIRAYCALANGGRLVKPRLVTSLTRDDTTIASFGTQDEGVVFSPETCAFMKEALVGVISRGTGKVAAIEGYTVAGKTGTAQKLKQRQYVGSFIGFLPANKPRAVVLVVVDEPQGAFYGADVAGPAFKAIGHAIMSEKGVPQDDAALTQYYSAHPEARPTKTVL